MVSLKCLKSYSFQRHTLNKTDLFYTSAKCKFQISEESQTCFNPACPSQGQQLHVTSGFDLPVDISDHTGTLQSCNLSGTVAEKTLGCKVSNCTFLLIFLNVDPSDRLIH